MTHKPKFQAPVATVMLARIYLERHGIAKDKIDEFRRGLARLMQNIGRPDLAPPLRQWATPADLTETVGRDHITCLECKRKFKVLGRHLWAEHQLTRKDYIAAWSLPVDYPMACQSYSEAKSAIFRKSGLKGGRPKGSTTINPSKSWRKIQKESTEHGD